MAWRWRSWLESEDQITLALAAGVGFVWGIVSLMVYPFSVAGLPMLAKLLIYLLA